MAAQFRHLQVDDLVGSAGGNPWEVNTTIQAGSPGEISELADAFHEASGCLLETKDEFDAAKQRFAAAWDRQDGSDHPINDSQEVQRATKSLQLNQEQLSRVAVDLQNIAASLAEAQRSGATSVRNLEFALQLIDNQIDREIAAAAANGEEVDVSRLREAAVERTRETLNVVHAVRDAYAEQLETSRLEMAAEGYTPEATEGADGAGGEPPNSDALAEAERYGAGQRALDEALVNSPGPWTPDKQAAAARLRDHATINNPTADIDEVRYAGQRLNDFAMSHAMGPLPADTVLGGDARTRAQFRQEWQQKLEQGLLDMPPMSPDAATAALDQAEFQARQLVIAGALEALQREGMSADGAAKAVGALSGGVPWEVLAAGGTSLVSSSGIAANAGHAAADPPGRHAADAITQSDLDTLKKVGTRLSGVGNLATVALGAYDVMVNGAPLGETTGKVAGTLAGGYLAGVGAWALAGTAIGPGGAIVSGLAGAMVLGFAGEKLGGAAGSVFDR